MENITTFELVAGSASIIALILALYESSRRLKQSLQEKRENTEREFERELENLRIAGGTVSARTDLGFFVLIQLGSLRETIDYYRQHRIQYLVFAVLFIILADFVRSTFEMMGFSTNLLILVTLPIVFALVLRSLIVHLLVMRLQKYANSYEKRIKEIWDTPIKKRIPTNDID